MKAYNYSLIVTTNNKNKEVKKEVLCYSKKDAIRMSRIFHRVLLNKLNLTYSYKINKLK